MKTLEHLPAFIETGLRVDDEELREWLSRDGADGSAIDERVEDYNDRQMHRWLSAIGHDALSEQLRTRLTELDGVGVIESPLESE